MKGASPAPLSPNLSFSPSLSGEKGSYYTRVSVWLSVSPLYNHCFQQHCQHGVNGERESGRDRYRAQMGVCVSSGSVQHQLCGSAFLVWSARHFCWICLCGELLFTPFFLFKGLNREHNLFKASFHMTHTGTHKHTHLSQEISSYWGIFQ